MHKLLVRSISGLIYVLIIIAALMSGGLYTCMLALLFAGIAGAEFIHLTSAERHPSQMTVMTDMAGTLCLAAAGTGIGFALWWLLLLVRMIEELYTRSATPIRDLAVSVFGQLYIGIPTALLMGAGIWDYITLQDPARSSFAPALLHVILAIFAMIWLNDTGAYLVGSMCGRHKMFERISPKKTWEGFVGGLLFCVGGSVAACFIIGCSGGLSMAEWIGLGTLTAAFATWGDLVESLFKRALGVKDSGTLIPGHGGILDRIDSLLMVLPAAALYLVVCYIL